MVKTGATSPIAPVVRKASSLFAKPSPTSTLPSVVSATILATVEAGTATSTPNMPVSMFTWASRDRVPPKHSGRSRETKYWTPLRRTALLRHQLQDLKGADNDDHAATSDKGFL
jgi:hypothetical protein